MALSLRCQKLCSINDVRKVCRSHCNLCSKSTSARPGAATFAQPATEALGQGSWKTLEGAQTRRTSFLDCMVFTEIGGIVMLHVTTPCQVNNVTSEMFVGMNLNSLS